MWRPPGVLAAPSAPSHRLWAAGGDRALSQVHMAPLAQLATWNVWLIPNSSSELGPRPLKQARRLCQLLEE
eukprot:COSAG04_NODE_5031_length_1774_cov_7.260896_1_plen_70_part_10